MVPIQSLDHNPMRAAHEAPRCEHIRLNGRRCAAPALRGQSHCHFHNHIQPESLDEQAAEPYLPFIEDATSLQFALMRVMRMLETGHADYKCCALMLYALQIACSNLKNFIAEHPKQEIAEGERPQEAIVSGGKQNKLNGKDGDQSSLAEFLLGFLAKGEKGNPDEKPPRIRSREDYYAVVEQRQRSSAALSGDTSLP